MRKDLKKQLTVINQKKLNCMNRSELFELIRRKRSFLCIGLDSEPAKIPVHLKDLADPVFEFNRQIIDSTIDLAVAYKPNLAFYETHGAKGWQSLTKTIEYLLKHKDRTFIIADAKRGDIGNTSAQYARAFFDAETGLGADAVTVAPYMGKDSVSPFLSYPGKWAVLLALTSNEGAMDFQFLDVKDDNEDHHRKLFEAVIETSSLWGDYNNMMYVVGATKSGMLEGIRKIVPDHFLLIPGVGAQGGSLEEVARYGMNKYCGLLVNASRSILFASSGTDFAGAARKEAERMQKQMESLLAEFSLL
jgi:orotidine-5'-phosphate decarboxylase